MKIIISQLIAVGVLLRPQSQSTDVMLTEPVHSTCNDIKVLDLDKNTLFRQHKPY